ncbi:MAG: hypothetical protein Kow0063_17900 [Anaerolineae bacterium]
MLPSREVGLTTPALDTPLRRLLKLADIQELLEEFQKLSPGAALALAGPDGRLFAGTDGWGEGNLPEELLAQAGHGQRAHAADVVAHPILVAGRLAGTLLARVPGAGSGGDKLLEHTLGSLGHSLSLLIEQALKTRELGRETLDRYREINLLYTASETISSCLDPDLVPDLVLDAARRVIQAVAGLVLLPSKPAPDKGDLTVAASFGDANRSRAPSPASSQIARQVYETGDGASLGPVVCVPLKRQEQVAGVVLLERGAGQPDFTASDEKLLTALAGQAAIALETARLHQEQIARQRLEEELAVGRQIQLSLLPERPPVVPGWEFAAAYRPAWQVGGDLYDFLEWPGETHRLGLLIADVTGKGVPAALFMAFSRTIMRSEGISGQGCGPATALKRANSALMRDIRPESMLFLSAFYATLDTRNGRLAYANGGHNWPLWLRADTGEIQPLDGRGIVLGAFGDIEIEEQEIEMAPGDLVIFYTDGLTEARDADARLFEEERLRATLMAEPGISAEQMVERIVKAVDAFTGETPQADDLTLLVVRRQLA